MGVCEYVHGCESVGVCVCTDVTVLVCVHGCDSTGVRVYGCDSVGVCA